MLPIVSGLFHFCFYHFPPLLGGSLVLFSRFSQRPPLTSSRRPARATLGLSGFILKGATGGVPVASSAS